MDKLDWIEFLSEGETEKLRVIFGAIKDFNGKELVEKHLMIYEKLLLHYNLTMGLYATEFPEKVIDPEKVLFQIGRNYPEGNTDGFPNEIKQILGKRR